MQVRETDLIGIGKKYHLKTIEKEEAVIIIHDDGRRELYSYDPDDGQSDCVLTLSDEESRQVAGIIGGMSYKPKALETVEVELDDLVIEWYKVPAKSPAAGQSIGGLEIRKQTGAAVIAALVGGGTEINPGPDYVIADGATLVVAGKRSHIRKFKDLFIPAS
jgi:TrkA domain protein